MGQTFDQYLHERRRLLKDELALVERLLNVPEEDRIGLTVRQLRDLRYQASGRIAPKASAAEALAARR